MKLHIDLFGAAKVDLEPNGAFYRSYVHDRRGDPHGSFFWLPQEGSDNNTPHLSRKRQDRVWLPEFRHDKFLDFLVRFQAAAFRSWLRGLTLLDLDRLEGAGWRFCTSAPPGFREECVTEDGPNDVNLNLSYQAILMVVEHTLLATERPTSFRERGPEGPSPIIPAVRFQWGELVAVKNVGWLEHGVWDPFIAEEPVQVGPPGWYGLPDRLMTRKRFLRLLGREGRNGIKLAAPMVQSFFGPSVRNLDAETRSFEQRIEELVSKVRR